MVMLGVPLTDEQRALLEPFEEARKYFRDMNEGCKIGPEEKDKIVLFYRHLRHACTAADKLNRYGTDILYFLKSQGFYFSDSVLCGVSQRSVKNRFEAFDRRGLIWTHSPEDMYRVLDAYIPVYEAELAASEFRPVLAIIEAEKMVEKNFSKK